MSDASLNFADISYVLNTTPYTKGLEKMFEDLFDRVVRKSFELGDDDHDCNDESPRSLFAQQAYKLKAGLNDPRYDMFTWTPMMNELCKWFVKQYYKKNFKIIF